jgi:hypothetical protein
MCNFFSFTGDGFGNFQYISWQDRKNWIAKKLALPGDGPDSHTSILEHLKIPKEKQERYSKYEYNPFTKNFVVDLLVDGHDEAAAENWVRAFDMKRAVEPLNIRPIIHPFKISPPLKITKTHLMLLKNWASVWDSVRASVGDSVWDSVWDSVRASVRAYTSSFFSIKYKYDCSSAIKLWKLGLVPSFNGKIWRLHGGSNAEILWEGTLK